jgi:hypothetical protein
MLDRRLVYWAPKNATIPLKCLVCGATFVTLNIPPLGSQKLYYGKDKDRSHLCESRGHDLKYIIPDFKKYLLGGDY